MRQRVVEARGCTKSTFRFWPKNVFYVRQLGLTHKMSKCASHPERNYFSLFPSSNSIGICINREKWDKVCTFSRQKSEMLKKISSLSKDQNQPLLVRRENANKITRHTFSMFIRWIEVILWCSSTFVPFSELHFKMNNWKTLLLLFL